MKKEMSLYLHIPFCNSKCNYCNFVSTVASDAVKYEYVENLKKEIKIRAKEYNNFYTIRSIYIGGGTPSSLPLGLIKEILQTIYRNFTVKNNAEITMELNPNTATREKVSEYVISGVNRFSIGLQCSSSKILKNMGRTHTLGDFDKTIDLIRSHGISNINADVIIGYPSQSASDVIDTVKYLIQKNIPHISSYMLSVEEGTALKHMVDTGMSRLPSESKVIKIYQEVVSLLAKNGYDRYEVSNFAKPGFMCKHNLVYWQREDYIGLGVASHSYVDGVRFSNTENIRLYCECIETKAKAPVADVVKLSEAEKKEEFIMLSLRTSEGINAERYQEEFKESFFTAHKETLASFIKLGLLVLDNEGNIKATQSGFLVLNKIILELCS